MLYWGHKMHIWINCWANPHVIISKWCSSRDLDDEWNTRSWRLQRLKETRHSWFRSNLSRRQEKEKQPTEALQRVQPGLKPLRVQVWDFSMQPQIAMNRGLGSQTTISARLFGASRERLVGNVRYTDDSLGKIDIGLMYGKILSNLKVRWNTYNAWHIINMLSCWISRSLVLALNSKTYTGRFWQFRGCYRECIWSYNVPEFFLSPSMAHRIPIESTAYSTTPIWSWMVAYVKYSCNVGYMSPRCIKFTLAVAKILLITCIHVLVYRWMDTYGVIMFSFEWGNCNKVIRRKEGVDELSIVRCC